MAERSTMKPSPGVTAKLVLRQGRVKSVDAGFAIGVMGLADAADHL